MAEESILGQAANNNTGAEGSENEQNAQGEEQNAQGEEQNAQGEEQNEQSGEESYSDFELPEGVELDSEALEAFTPIAKELNLSQEQAQKLVSLYADQIGKVAGANSEAFTALVDGWRNETKADKEIGGADYLEKAAVALTAIDKFGTPALKQVLNDYGFGNHPELLRFCYRVGKELQESKFVQERGESGGSEKLPHEIMYGK
jgi:hypothetical protein